MRIIDADVYADEMKERQEAVRNLLETADNETPVYTEADRWTSVLMTFAEAALCLQEQPTVDAEPVRHGHWTMEAIMPTIAFDTVRVIGRCSECGCYDAICNADAMGYYKGTPIIWAGFITNYAGNERIAEEFALANAKNREKRRYCPACGARMD